MEQTAASTEASADKIGAVGSTTKALLGQLEDLQGSMAADIPELENKVPSVRNKVLQYAKLALDQNRVLSTGVGPEQGIQRMALVHKTAVYVDSIWNESETDRQAWPDIISSSSPLIPGDGLIATLLSSKYRRFHLFYCKMARSKPKLT